MKRVVAALVCFGAPIAAFSQSVDGNLEFGAQPSSISDLGRVLRTSVSADTNSAEIVTDDRAESRGSPPSIAYSIFQLNWQNADASLQPIFGRINGAQIKVNW